MKYNFDELIERADTACVKYDFRKGYFGTEDLIPMWVADMDFKTPPFIIEAIKKRLDHEVLGYAIKTPSFYQSIIDWVKRRHQWDIKPQWISFAPGIVPAVCFAIQAFSNAGDKILVPTPVYHPFLHMTLNNGRQLVSTEMKIENNRYVLDYEDIERKIDFHTKMILLSNPHNPMSRVWTKEELLRLAEICVRKNVLIVSDEIHSDLILKGYKHIPTATLSPEIANVTVTCIAPSKTFNSAALAASAVIISNPRLKAGFDRAMANTNVEGGNVFGLVGLEAAYTHGDEWLEQLLDYLQENFNYLKNFIATRIPKLKVFDLEGTYLVWIDCRELGLKGADLKHFMIYNAKVGMNDGASFGQGGEGFQRMNIACPRAILQKALEQIESAINELEFV